MNKVKENLLLAQVCWVDNVCGVLVLGNNYFNDGTSTLCCKKLYCILAPELRFMIYILGLFGVLMPNHFHMICSCVDDHEPGMVFKNVKSFTALKLINAILNNPKAEENGCWIFLKKTGYKIKVTFTINSGNTKIIPFY